jgi:hypothetical protein
MWLFTNDAFVSIVEHRDDPDTMLVRGRFRGDAARFLGVPQHHEIELTTADYRWRVITDRASVEKALLRSIRRAHYPNFKDSIRTAWRRAIAMRVWSVLAVAQAERGGK